MIYEALSNIRHNGVSYEAGQIVRDLSEEDAKLLLDANVVAVKEEHQDVQAAAVPSMPDGFPMRDIPPAQPQPPVEGQPAPAPSLSNVPSPEEVAAAAAPINGQPSPEEVAATAAQIQ
jgi:hypothetical protein